MSHLRRSRAASTSSCSIRRYRGSTGSSKLIRAADQTLRVIVVTGKQETREAAEVLEIGVFAYVLKPCDFTQLEHLVVLALLDVINPGFGVTDAFSTV